MTGVVTRGGKAVGGGRVGGWQKRRKEMNRLNVAILRGRTRSDVGLRIRADNCEP